MKKNLGAKNVLYPMLIVIIGCEVNGKANFNTINNVGIIDQGILAIGMGKNHYSNQGIKENRTLSVNIPSAELVERVDYIGMNSGEKTDKSQVFRTFAGTLHGAPMIDEASLCMECEVIDIYDRPNFDVFIVKVVNTYCESDIVTDGRIDYLRVNPLFYDMTSLHYWKFGERMMRAYTVGKNYLHQ